MWLRGDRRGWVDEGRVLPPDPDLESQDRWRMKHSPYQFPKECLLRVGEFLGRGLIDTLNISVLALTVQTWHAHFVIGPTFVDIATIVKTAKERVRRGLKEQRPVWGNGYDKRFCFDLRTLRNRVAYVERHNLEMGWPAPLGLRLSLVTPDFAPRCPQPGASFNQHCGVPPVASNGGRNGDCYAETRFPSRISSHCSIVMPTSRAWLPL